MCCTSPARQVRTLTTEFSSRSEIRSENRAPMMGQTVRFRTREAEKRLFHCALSLRFDSFRRYSQLLQHRKPVEVRAFLDDFVIFDPVKSHPADSDALACGR